MSGIDYAWERPDPRAIVQAGHQFVIRYLSYDRTGKNLTAAEAKSLAAAGLDLVSNWEYAPGAPLNGHDQGVMDARAAATQHTACGGPSGAPIYFSVDVDVTGDQLGAVADYFRGVASVLGLGRTGAYGGYRVVRYLFDLGLIQWGWQTRAWSRDSAGHVQWDVRAQLRQTGTAAVGGAQVDVNESQRPAFGQWRPGGAAPMSIAAITQDDWDTLRWRMDALIYGRAATAGGPTKGEAAWLPKRLDDLAAGMRPVTAAEIAQALRAQGFAREVAAELVAMLAPQPSAPASA